MRTQRKSRGALEVLAYEAPNVNSSRNDEWVRCRGIEDLGADDIHLIESKEASTRRGKISTKMLAESL